MAYFSKWLRTYRYAASTPDPKGSQIDLLQKSVPVELHCEVDTDFDFARKLKDEAKALRSRVSLLFAVSDDQDPAIAYVLPYVNISIG